MFVFMCVNACAHMPWCVWRSEGSLGYLSSPSTLSETGTGALLFVTVNFRLAGLQTLGHSLSAWKNSATPSGFTWF